MRLQWFPSNTYYLLHLYIYIYIQVYTYILLYMTISPANIENTYRYYYIAEMLLYTIRDRLSNTYYTRYKKVSRIIAATDTNISIVNKQNENNILLYAKNRLCAKLLHKNYIHIIQLAKYFYRNNICIIILSYYSI